jgi:hypothetical protein
MDQEYYNVCLFAECPGDRRAANIAASRENHELFSCARVAFHSLPGRVRRRGMTRAVQPVLRPARPLMQRDRGTGTNRRTRAELGAKLAIGVCC